MKDQCLSTRANFDIDMLHIKWTLSQMQKDALKQDLPTSDEACAKDLCLRQGVEALDLLDNVLILKGLIFRDDLLSPG